ncbi:hypothetical protein ASPWEDRAFT_122758 [Aspergillus wentii DTO 134E9]|uniref:Glutathionylspermidine synthase pre-ATP-grasp-like domain-containing protein n=1 Tax=Aspergillus wentii DTO 134E9 TaxID=1073089 RepID=A0A1L9RYS6_ASPWE|nr:uncharacterized protein ASPWEDRAFT_122758 [Aspergillus wentii DTO 134E9]KAI9932551.1 hypothetical protein MW887_008793 [Aspergillus wentii]OJJ40116.1 hypothetical protein ASPWEDRAFT_122758 [Aspergillus wentii DTO 134E9]
MKIQQICLTASNCGQFRFPADVDPSIHQHDWESYTASLLRSCPESIWPQGSPTAHSLPMLVTAEDHINPLRAFHDALVAAIVDIVNRWWTDTAADFPARMPIEPYEESLLRWMNTLPAGTVAPFEKCLGSWRPDFLIEHVADPSSSDGTREQFRVCEINARFCWNGYLHGAYGQQALDEMGAEERGFRGAADCEETLNELLSLFDTSKPLHFLKGEEKGIDIHMFAHAVEERTGIRPRFITPEDLRLVPSIKAPLGQKLCCVVSPDAETSPQSTIFEFNGEWLEEIYQVNLELHQRELRAMPTKILRHVSLHCFNDMRTIFLVHDKRMLGIILQELDVLINRHVLTPSQADLLREGISTTFIPGSPEMAQFTQDSQVNPTLKDGYILKPIRSGKGAGILFGDELSWQDWQTKLQTCQQATLAPGQMSYVVQRHIPQGVYDVCMKNDHEKKQMQMVGTYHVVNGRYLGIGTWRCSPARICAVSRGGSMICSVYIDDAAM